MQPSSAFEPARPPQYLGICDRTHAVERGHALLRELCCCCRWLARTGNWRVQTAQTSGQRLPNHRSPGLSFEYRAGQARPVFVTPSGGRVIASRRCPCDHGLDERVGAASSLSLASLFGCDQALDLASSKSHAFRKSAIAVSRRGLLSRARDVPIANTNAMAPSRSMDGSCIRAARCALWTARATAHCNHSACHSRAVGHALDVAAQSDQAVLRHGKTSRRSSAKSSR